MKATLEFTLPEEKHEHELAMNAATMYCAICDLDNHLRNLIKHGDDSECFGGTLINNRLRIPELPVLSFTP